MLLLSFLFKTTSFFFGQVYGLLRHFFPTSLYAIIFVVSSQEIMNRVTSCPYHICYLFQSHQRINQKVLRVTMSQNQDPLSQLICQKYPMRIVLLRLKGLMNKLYPKFRLLSSNRHIGTDYGETLT